MESVEGKVLARILKLWFARFANYGLFASILISQVSFTTW